MKIPSLKYFKYYLLIVGFIQSCIAFSQRLDSPNTLAIAPFGIEYDKGEESDYSRILAEKVLVAVVRSKKFNVIDRSDAETVMKEIALWEGKPMNNFTEWNEGDMSRYGQRLKADFILIGTVSNVEFPLNAITGSYKAKASFTIKIINVRSSQICDAESFEVSSGSITKAYSSREEAISAAFESVVGQVEEFIDKFYADFLHLPFFPWPPPQCAQRYTLVKKLKLISKTLSDIDTKLQSALDSQEYELRSYFQVPNGFALVTQLEQFKEDGLPESDNNRWAEYPAQAQIKNLFDYLESLIMPKYGHFRIFVFVVTDSPYQFSEKKIMKEEASKWLIQGFNMLPKKIGANRINEQHYLDVLIYEFEAPESTKKCAIKCPCLINAQTHLEKSGLSKHMRF